MNILLINVSLRPESKLKLFPLGLAYIATAMKKAGYGFDLLDIDLYRYSDDHIREFINKKKYDVVCMGCLVTGYKRVKWLCSVVKESNPDAVTIVGNSVATSVPDILLTKTKADIAVMGEGDITIVELLNAIEKSKPVDSIAGICILKDGKVFHTAKRPYIKDLSTLPFVDYEIFDIKEYLKYSNLMVNEPLPVPREQIRVLPLNTARGCIARCTFCYHVFKDAPFRPRPVSSLLDEIEHLIKKYSLTHIFFYDELSFHTKKLALEFAEGILERGLKFYWDTNCRGNLFNEDSDVEILLKMKEAGCMIVGYSLESAVPEILKEMNKHMSVEEFTRQTQLVYKSGMAVGTSIVLGYPQETPETIHQTMQCCIDNNIYPSTGYLLPQPGSKMFDYAVENGFIKDIEQYLLAMGDRQDLRINMTKMTDSEFEECVKKELARCNRELKVGLDENALIKTQHLRAPEEKRKEAKDRKKL